MGGFGIAANVTDAVLDIMVGRIGNLAALYRNLSSEARGNTMLKHLRQEQINAIIRAAEALNEADPPSEEGIELPRDLERVANRRESVEPYIEALRATIAKLSLDARFELMALLWFGRDDGPYATATFEDFLKHARTVSDEGDVEYIAEKSLVLPQYLLRGQTKLNGRRDQGH